MKIRLAVYTHTLNFWGGSFQYARAFTEALAGLDREKYDIHVWHLEDDEWARVCAECGFVEHILDQYEIPTSILGEVKKNLQALNEVPEEYALNRSKLFAALNQFSSEREFEKFAPHIVVNPQMDLPRLYPGAKQIGVIHDLMHRYETRFPEVGDPEEIRAREKLFNDIVHNCDAILVDSRTGAKHVLDCYPYARLQPEKLKVLPFTAFKEIVHVEATIPSFEVPEKFFFYPAQFWMHKNHSGLARAVASIRDTIPEIKIVVAGNTKKNGYSSFMEIVSSEKLEDNFIIPGYVPAGELKWLYQHARAMIMPTFFGPTNIPPMEAMALGCPVAISSVYDMPEQCGNAALYFKPEDDREISSTLCRLWRDDALCKDLADKGEQWAKRYNEKVFGKQVRRIIEDIEISL